MYFKKGDEWVEVQPEVVFGYLQDALGGGGNSTSLQITLTIGPTTAGVIGGADQELTATAAGITNIAVDWAVNGVAGGQHGEHHLQQRARFYARRVPC